MIRHTIAASSSVVVNDNFYMAPVTTEMRNRRRNQSECIYLERESSLKESVNKRKRNYSECIGVTNAMKRKKIRNQKIADGFRTLAEFVPKRETPLHRAKNTRLETLESAIEYIKELSQKLEEDQTSTNVSPTFDEDQLLEFSETIETNEFANGDNNNNCLYSVGHSSSLHAPSCENSSITTFHQQTSGHNLNKKVSTDEIQSVLMPPPAQIMGEQSSNITMARIETNNRCINLENIQGINEVKRNLQFEMLPSYDEANATPKITKKTQKQSVRRVLRDITNTANTIRPTNLKPNTAASQKPLLKKTITAQNPLGKLSCEYNQLKETASPPCSSTASSIENPLQKLSSEYGRNKLRHIDFSTQVPLPQNEIQANYLQGNVFPVQYVPIQQIPVMPVAYQNNACLYATNNVTMIEYDWRQNYIEQWRESCFQQMAFRGNN